MSLSTSRRRSLFTLFSAALVAACLVAQPAAAQTAHHSATVAPVPALVSAPAVGTEDAVAAAPVLATESAARAGVARAETRNEARTSAAQGPSDNTMRWGIILLIALAAAVLIVSLAD